jgi:hypothetical protein
MQSAGSAKRIVARNLDPAKRRGVAKADPVPIGTQPDNGNVVPRLIDQQDATGVGQRAKERRRARERRVPDRMRLARIEARIDRETSSPKLRHRRDRSVAEPTQLFWRMRSKHKLSGNRGHAAAIPTSDIDDRDQANSHNRRQSAQSNESLASCESCPNGSPQSA